MKFNFVKAIGVILLTSSIAHGVEIGHGHDAVVCRNNNDKIISAELLDIYEGRELRNLPFVEQNLSDDDYLDFFAQKLKLFSSENRLSSFTRKQLSDKFQTLFYVLEGVKNGQTPESKDYLLVEDFLKDRPDYDVVAPVGCSIEQIMIKQEKRFKIDPLYIIQSEIIKALPLSHIRVLVLHSFLAELLFIESADTKNLRYFLQKLSSTSIENYHYIDYLEGSKLREAKRVSETKALISYWGNGWRVHDELNKLDVMDTLKYGDARLKMAFKCKSKADTSHIFWYEDIQYTLKVNGEEVYISPNNNTCNYRWDSHSPLVGHQIPFGVVDFELTIPKQKIPWSVFANNIDFGLLTIGNEVDVFGPINLRAQKDITVRARFIVGLQSNGVASFTKVK
jgi:hypothetical protein